jgi:hypothetical protein
VQGIKDGNAYVTDGKSHLLDFSVNGLRAGTKNSEVKLSRAETVQVTAKVAARLDEQPDETIRSKRYDVKPYWELERARMGNSREVPVELIVNGEAIARKIIVADGTVQDVRFETKIEKSSWLALRILPSSHTNPMFVLVNNQPIRASQKSAEWCLQAVDRCWTQKAPKISQRERDAAEKAYEHARKMYRQILAESK